jgi:cytochrome c biogenesis protein CcdA
MSREDQQTATTGRLNSKSRFWRILLVVLGAVLVFAGPTYIVYVLLSVLDLSYFVSMGLGIILFVIGLMFIWFLIRRKIIS